MMWTREPDDLLFDLLDRCITGTRIRFVLPGRTVTIGASATPKDQPDLLVRVVDTRFSRRVLTQGNLGLAESFMDQGWTVETGTLEGLLTVLAKSGIDERLRKDPRLLMRIAAMRIQHVFTGAHANIHLHYDLGDEIYESFLDEAKVYTCGYQKEPGESLAQIQHNKLERACQKLKIAEGDRVLDIGCGYGGFIIYAAQHHGARSHGVTLSKVQAEGAMRRVQALGLSDRVTVEYGDFRAVRGAYDKVASFGMAEHLYPHEHAEYFDTIGRLLDEHGLAMVHSMACIGDKNLNDPFTQKYLFPGSTHPRLSAFISQLERLRLPVLDVENVGRSYQPTTKLWLANFRENRHRLDPRRYDARFQRMYEYYLAMCVAATDAMVGAVFQVLFTKDYQRHLPFVRV